jgi:hypothetical protein
VTVSHYAYRAQWSPADEFPSLSWLAPTTHEALAGIAPDR